MNDAQIEELLRRRNPWWRLDGWAQVDPVLDRARSAPFDYRPDPLRGIAPAGLYTLTGPRRVGKSLELKRAIQRLIDSGVSSRRIVFASCDGMNGQDVRRVFQVARNILQPATETMWWFIDEITAVTGDWSAIVKEARDNTELAHDCVVLTGSSARGMRSAMKNLAGRRGGAQWTERLLLPAGFRSFCEMSGAADEVPRGLGLGPQELGTGRAAEVFSELSFWSEHLLDAWHRYMVVGGFPEAIRESQQSGEPLVFADTLWQVIEGEAFASGTFQPSEVSGLVRELAGNICSPVNASRIARDVGLSGSRAANDRINALQVAFQVWSCHRELEMAPHLRSARKVYFVDPLLARLPAIKFGLPEVDRSQLTEQQMGIALWRRVSGPLEAGDTQGAVMYRVTPSRSEIDFVGPQIARPIEVKFQDTGWKRAAQTLGSQFGHGIVGTRRTTDLSGPVMAVPVPCLAWALDVPD